MKLTVQIFRGSIVLLMLGSMGFFLAACDKEEPQTVPTIEISPVTDITPKTAKLGATIVHNGGSGIINSGFVYSSTSLEPTLQDNFVEAGATEGLFEGELADLSSSTIYYVRAYAINNIGTAFSESVSFTTGNAAPTALNVAIAGTVQANKVVTVTYTYNDPEDDLESATAIQWHLANDAAGTGKTAIAGATLAIYTVKIEDEGKYIGVSVTPKAATGATAGQEVVAFSPAPVGEATEVTFTYNGAEVTYGILISPVTQRRWLDRNLGAPVAATAYNDFANYGDAFQWGRGVDGHQITTRAAATAGNVGVNGTEATLATSDTPGHNKFILTSAAPSDWRNPQNDNLWQGEDGVNNPCPNGFRIPTIDEWVAENLTTAAAGYTQLKLTLGGHRLGTGSFSLTGNFGYYWSSSIPTANPANAAFIRISPTLPLQQTNEPRGMAQSCRCIKD